MEEAAKSLLVTLNNAIQFGMEKLPIAAEFALDEYRRYLIAMAFASAGYAVMCGLVCFLCFWACRKSYAAHVKAGSMDPIEMFGFIGAILFGVGAAVAFFSSLINVSIAIDYTVKYVAPIGSLIAKAIK